MLETFADRLTEVLTTAVVGVVLPAVKSGTGTTGLFSEQEALVPPFKPLQDQVHSVAPSTLLILDPALQL